MLQEYIALLPEILLLLGILAMLAVRLLRHRNTPKTFYTLSRFFIVLAIIFSAIFYNQNITGYLQNNSFTNLFKFLMYTFILIWNHLSVKRFISKNTPSFMFYTIIMVDLLCMSLAISAINLWVLCASLSLGFLCNYPLLTIEETPQEKKLSAKYFIFSLLFVAAFAFGVFLIRNYISDLSYANILRNIETEEIPYSVAILSASLILAALLFMMGIAPFHFWFAEAVSISVLPVAGYLTIIPIFAYYACFINISANVFVAVLPCFYKTFIICGVLSVLAGAIGANSEDNLRKIFAYSGLYCMGVILLGLFPLNGYSLISSFIYLLAYIIAVSGIYTVLYGYRSKGKYLSCLEDIKGVYSQRPYISAALLLFMISLIGIPPMLGFLGKLSIINNMVIDGKFTIIGIILFAMIILVYAYLKIITAVYFEVRNNGFDIVDKGVYICMVICILVMVAIIIDPQYLMYEIENNLMVVLK